MPRLLLAVLLALLAQGAAAAGNNFYVCGSAATCNAGSSGWSSGSDSNNCTSKATPCATTAGVTGKMGSGDIAIYGNGSYSVPSCSLVAGSPANGYTTIKAEQMGGVTMGGVNCQLSGTNPKYWTYDGIFFSDEVIVAYVDHIKFIRCGQGGAGNPNSSNFAASQSASYILFENCYAYGPGRYKFLSWHADNVVMRQNVARNDSNANTGGQQIAGLVMYTMSNGLMANNVVVDSDNRSVWGDGSPVGCYYIPDTSGSTLNIVINTNLCLNAQYGGVQEDGGEGGGSYTTTVNATNNVIWNAANPTDNWTNKSQGTNSQWTGNTFGNGPNSLAYLSLYNSSGVTIYNNLFYSIQSPLAVYWQYGTHNYNAFYAITSGMPTLSANERTNINPLWNASTNPTGALKYIARIEPGSNLTGLGQGGANIGATLQYMIGVPGTMYGETGYDTVQSTPMWPFPHEDVIKAKMAAYAGTPTGARGFAATGNGLYGGTKTLTSYVWEYLGNACPADICTYGQSNPTINSVSCTQTSYTQSPGGIPCTASVTGTVTSWAWSLQTPDANCSFSAQTQSPTLTCAYGGTRKPCVTVQPGGASACAANSYGWKYAKPSDFQVN